MWSRARVRSQARSQRPSEVPPCQSAGSPSTTTPQTGTARVKRGMADMLKGGVIMDVVTPEQAKIAEDAGAVAVMALERVPADIRAQGGVARMSDPDMIDGIIAAVSIPVMAKCRIGHFVEAQVLQAIGVDYIDESEVLTPADEAHHVDKWAVHRAVRLRRHQPRRGAAADRRGRGDDQVEGRGGHRQRGRGDPAHAADPGPDLRRLATLSDEELFAAAKDLQAPYELVAEVAGPGSCRSSCSPPAASPRRPTRR